MTNVKVSGSDAMTAPMSPRAARSREKMLSAATELLVVGGARSVTVDAVADASGVAKSTLYRHWTSRDEMLVDVVRCNVPDVGDVDLAGSFDTVLRSFLRTVAETLGDPEWSRIIPALMSLRATMPEIAEVIEADRASKIDTLRSILDVGVAEGAIDADVDVNDVEKLLLGPLVHCAMIGEEDRVPRLAGVVADRFIASSKQPLSSSST